MTIPTTAAEMTPENVTELVRTRFPAATVGSVDVEATHLFGDGDVSTAGRVEIRIGEVDGADLPERLVVKVARPDLPATPLYENEVAVYTHLRDELTLQTPRCYGSRFDAESGRFGLILEDLTERDVVFGNVLVDVTLDHIRSVLAQVATLHGTYWNSPRFDDDLSWLQPHTAGDLHTLFNHPDIVPALIRSEVATQPFKAEILASIGQDPDSLYTQMQRVQTHQSTLPTTVVHGDLHVGNTCYLPDGTGGFIDWQLTSRGRYIHDIGYFLITSMPADTRRANERELLGFYLEQLAATGVEAPSLDEAWLEYRRSAVWSLYIGWLTTPVENYGWSINVANHIRLATAYRDLETALAVAELRA